MYLSDGDIVAKLGDLDFEVDDGHSFEPDDQIQPCSIDLRLSTVIWRPIGFGKSRTIDLTRSKLLEISPRRNWRRIDLRAGETIVLRPGEMVLGRVHERFTVPDDCAAQIEGRSSFARMGLAVHCTGSFINPGWRGHMPLTLINHGPVKLRIPPHLPICQLMLIPLSSAPTRRYGEPSLRNKYMNDDGGPSFWWRDKQVGRLLNSLGHLDASHDIQQALLDRIGVPVDEVLARLELLVSSRATGTYGNIDDLLQDFVEREDKKRMTDSILRSFGKGTLPVMASVSGGSFLVQPIGILHIIIWVLTILAIPFAVAAFRSGPGEYLGRKEFAALERRRQEGVQSSVDA